MTLQANIRYRSVWSADGGTRDLGAGREKSGGEITVAAGKSRPGGGEAEYVHTGPSTQAPIVIVYELWVIRPHLAWMRSVIERASASLSGQVLEGNVPVETFEAVNAVPIRIGEITSDSTAEEDKATVEVEYMVGARP